MMIPGYIKIFRQRPTLPHSLPCSTIGAKELNFRVRDGNGCHLFAIATEKSIWCCVFRVSSYLIKVKSLNSKLVIRNSKYNLFTSI